MTMINSKFETVGCNICGCLDYKELFRSSDFRFKKPGVFGVVRCKSCGLMYTNPRPRPDQIETCYPPEYYNSFSFSLESNFSEFSLTKINPLLRILKRTDLYKSYDALRRRGLVYIPPKEWKGRVLELGCGKGIFISKLKQMGWEAYGVEMDEESANYAKNQLKVNIYCGKIEDINFKDDYFDLVVAWMVIEHLHDPLKTLKKISNIIKPDGLLVFSIPNVKSIEAVVFKSKWFAYDLPRHLYHFTPKSIKMLLDKVGFNLTKITYQTNVDNIIFSIRYLLKDARIIPLKRLLLNILRLGNALLLLLLLPLGWILSILRLSGNMTLFARLK